MLVHQYLDEDTFTLTYLLTDGESGFAALIDPVATQVDFYLSQLSAKGLQILCVLDTHTHADHISANGKLREKTGCVTYMGKESHASCIDRTFENGDEIRLGGIIINVLHTPGHTDDSYSFYVKENDRTYLFTGDTLLINGTGRTDFQNGDAREQYHSLFDNLLTFDDDTVVYPGHDYNGRRSSTIGEEKINNPRLQVKDVSAYVALMNTLNLPNPKYMDVAVPANRACGKVN